MARSHLVMVGVALLTIGYPAEAARDREGERAGILTQQGGSADADAIEVRVHPGALAELIDQLGGRRVLMPGARVLVVLNPRAFLVEPASSLPPISRLDRLLILVDQGELRVGAAALVGANVTVLGVARTLLGAQVLGQVPWPTELTRETLERLDIRAVVIATSVQTGGVELTDRVLGIPPPRW